MSESGTDATDEEIMRATYRALCKHGYANLTTKAIAEESGKSKALLHYYYDTKEALLVAFLEYLLNNLREKVEPDADADPVEQLTTVLDQFVFGPDDYEEFQTAMLELRSQAPYNPAYREQLRTNDREITGLFADVIERGVAAGVFREVDPERTATFLVSTLDGARTRWIVLDDHSVLTDVHEELLTYVSERLLAGDREVTE